MAGLLDPKIFRDLNMVPQMQLPMDGISAPSLVPKGAGLLEKSPELAAALIAPWFPPGYVQQPMQLPWMPPRPVPRWTPPSTGIPWQF